MAMGATPGDGVWGSGRGERVWSGDAEPSNLMLVGKPVKRSADVDERV